MKLIKNSYFFGVCFVTLLPASAEGFTPPPSTTTAFTKPATSNSITYSASNSNVVDDDTNKVVVAEYDTTQITLQLDEILRSKSSSLFDDLSEIRKNGSQEEIEGFLNTILANVDETNDNNEGVNGSSVNGSVNGSTSTSGGDTKLVKFPWWTKMRFTARISRRARLASLQRVLDLSTPSAEETESLGDDEDAKKRRRRRALLVLLRSLAQTTDDDVNEGDKATSSKSSSTTNAIYKIEKAAKKDLKESISTEDMDSRVPPGLETPKYDVIVKRPVGEGGYEVRNYEAFSVCSVPMKKPRPDEERTDQKVKNPQLSGASSFGALAGYLFGKNEEQTAMKMTTPVLTQGEGEKKEMSFILPSNYWGDENIAKAPTPLENSLVKVRREEGGNRAAIMFGGFSSAKDVKAKKERLLNGLESDKEWMAIDNDVTIAQYNDPFTPPWKRRNEVSVAVKRRDE